MTIVSADLRLPRYALALSACRDVLFLQDRNRWLGCLERVVRGVVLYEKGHCRLTMPGLVFSAFKVEVGTGFSSTIQPQVGWAGTPSIGW